jgi:predicted nucleic acid-binding protein
MILVDSSVWIDYFNGMDSDQTNRLDQILGDGEAVIGDLMIAEVLQGCDTDRDFSRLQQSLDAVPTIEIGSREIAIAAAQNFRLLRKHGVTIRKTIDTLIATRCIQDKLPLLFSDKDFQPFVLHLGLVDGLAEVKF